MDGSGHQKAWRAAAIAIFVLGILTGCINDPGEVAELTERMQAGVEVAENVEILWSDSARIRVIATAPIMLNYLDNADQRQEFPAGLHVTFFDEQQDTSSTLIAKWGVYRSRVSEITVRDSVIWESVDLQRLETEELNWQENTQRIYTSKFVVLRQPDYLITGYGLEADQSFSNAKVLQVDGRIPLNRPEE